MNRFEVKIKGKLYLMEYDEVLKLYKNGLVEKGIVEMIYYSQDENNYESIMVQKKVEKKGQEVRK